MDLLKMLLEVGETKPEKEVYIKRFGFAFKIQAVNYKEMKRLREQATFYTKKNGEEFQPELFNALIISNGVISPAFTEPSVTAKYGTAEDAVQSLLLPGEIQRLSEEISELSGFGEESDEEVKN